MSCHSLGAIALIKLTSSYGATVKIPAARKRKAKEVAEEESKREIGVVTEAMVSEEVDAYDEKEVQERLLLRQARDLLMTALVDYDKSCEAHRMYFTAYGAGSALMRKESKRITFNPVELELLRACFDERAKKDGTTVTPSDALARLHAKGITRITKAQIKSFFGSESQRQKLRKGRFKLEE